MTDPLSTLTIVTADHSHGLTLSGYPKRGVSVANLVILKTLKSISGTDIFGYDPKAPEYLSLMQVALCDLWLYQLFLICFRYATGPGHKEDSWSLLEEQKLHDKDFRFTFD